MFPEIWCLTGVIVISHFGLFFALLPPNSPKNEYFEKIKKMPGDIIISHIYNKNYDQMMYDSWDMMQDRQMDGWMDKWKKLYIENKKKTKKHHSF